MTLDHMETILDEKVQVTPQTYGKTKEYPSPNKNERR